MSRVSILWLISLFFCGQAAAQTPEQKKETVAFLRGLQVEDGGFLVAPGQGASSLRATSAALRGLKYFGGEPAQGPAAIGFVQRCYDSSVGGFADRPGGEADVFCTAVGYMAIVELKLPTEDYERPVLKFLGARPKTFDDIRIAAAGLELLGKLPPQSEKWLADIAKLRNEDGTSGKGEGTARETARVIVTMLRLQGKLADKEVVVKTLKAGQRADGGFGKADEKASDLESCYQVMRAFHMLEQTPDANKLRGFVASCRNADGGYAVAAEKTSTAPATYYASVLLHWLGEK